MELWKLINSQYIHACGSYHYFRDRGCCKQGNYQEFLVVKNWSHRFESFTVAAMTLLTITA